MVDPLRLYQILQKAKEYLAFKLPGFKHHQMVEVMTSMIQVM